MGSPGGSKRGQKGSFWTRSKIAQHVFFFNNIQYVWNKRDGLHMFFFIVGVQWVPQGDSEGYLGVQIEVEGYMAYGMSFW